MQNVYRTILNEAMQLPKREPRPIPPPVKKKTWKEKFTEPMSMKDVSKAAASNVYSLLASAAFGTRTLEDKVPVTQLHRQMALHVNRFIAEAMIREGRLPMRILLADRFLTTIDLGSGRVITLRVQLHKVSDIRSTTEASFIVEEGDFVAPWDTHFEVNTKYDKIPDSQLIGDSKIQKALMMQKAHHTKRYQ